MGAVQQLGYVVFEVSNLGAWRSFGEKVLGLGIVNDRGTDGFSLRMDGHQQRFFIEHGTADDLAAVGWQIADAKTLDALIEHLIGAGHDAVHLPSEDAARRNVERLARVIDPAGIVCELYCGPTIANSDFKSSLVPSGFVADEQGLGHVVLVANDQEEHKRFYTDLLGFKLSDYIHCEYFGHKIDITFMHTNARHHSLAFGKGRDKHIHHFMVEAKSIEEVGRCYDRFLFSGGMIHQTLGRHPNDKMFSFYGYTPSGFHFEFGYGGLEVNDDTWESTTHGMVSEWGHHPPHLLTKAFRDAKKAKAEAEESKS